MQRMIDLMRQSAVPANVMRSAAKGALALPPAEIIEILVYLTTNPVFAETARMTLAGWDEASSLAAAADPGTPQPVLDYMMAPQNRRPKLIPALLENPSVPESQLLDMAQAASREVVDMMLASARVESSAHVLHALATNHHLNDLELSQLHQALRKLGEEPSELPENEVLAPGEKTQYEIEHAAEIAAEEGKTFELVGDILDLGIDAAKVGIPVRSAEPPAAPAPAAAEAAPATAAAAPAAAAQAPADPVVKERISTLQKIARLSVGERVQLAMKGTKDERFILIRDGSKVVSQAVLESPKISDQEVETYAAMKNVQESVLRGITMKRKYMKNYAVIRALATNPRTPLDLGLTMLNHLLVNDLRNLSMNKNISETIRKIALKLYKQKSSSGGKKME